MNCQLKHLEIEVHGGLDSNILNEVDDLKNGNHDQECDNDDEDHDSFVVQLGTEQFATGGSRYAYHGMCFFTQIHIKCLNNIQKIHFLFR